MRQATDGSPYDGMLMNYVNPITGGPVMQTIGASMQMLRPGEKTKAHRHTGSFIYQVAKGRGYSIIGGKRFEWQERDIFCVPSWAWHEHANGFGSEDACLFCFNDLPVIAGPRPLSGGGLRRQRRPPAGRRLTSPRFTERAG